MADLVAATRRPRRYMLVGLACAAIHNGVMVSCVLLGIHYIAALVISFLILAPTGYVLHSRYTFERNMERVRFLRFAGGMLAAFPINFGLMLLLVEWVGLNALPATLLCTGAMFVWNYLSAQWAILRRHGKSPSQA